MFISLAGGIVLTVLKVLLVLLLVIILLVFLIAGLILLVSFRYKVHVEKYDTIKAEGRVSWLLGIICVIFTYDDGSSSYKLKIFGADYKKLSNIFKKKTKVKKDKYDLESAEYKEDSREDSYGEKRETKKEKETEKNTAMETSQYNTKSAENGMDSEKAFKYGRPDKEKKDNRPAGSSSKTSGSREEKKEEDSQYKASQEEHTSENRNTRKNGITGKIRNIPGKIKALRESIKKSFEKAKDAKEKLVRIKDFIFSETTKGIVCVTKNNVLHLLKKIRPRKIKSDILFGTGDPCQTGQALGVIAVYMAMTGTVFNITPDFENQVLRGRLEISGHIRIVTFLIVALKIVSSREWKDFYKEAMKIKEEL